MFEQIDGILAWGDLVPAGPAEFRSLLVPLHRVQHGLCTSKLSYVPQHRPHVPYMTLTWAILDACWTLFSSHFSLIFALIFDLL